MTEPWVVLVEAERPTAGAVLGIGQLDRLLDLLAEQGPSGLWSVDRYALQFVLDAPTPEAALITGLGRWREAASKAGLNDWRLVRAELKTPAELEAEHRAAVGDDEGPCRVFSSVEALHAAYLSTRRLLYCRSRAQAAGVVADLARRLGAELVGASGDPAVLAIDLSLGEGPPHFPTADPISMERLELEELLPTVMLDATRAVRLLETPLLVES